MQLYNFDGKRVRIICHNGDVFEGICYHNSAEYNEHEYSKNEESLEIVNIIFYRSNIKEVEMLENFHNPYGKFEEITVEDGIDSIEDVLFSEEDEHITRLLEFLLNYKKELPDKVKILELIEKLLKYNNNEKIKDKVQKLIEKWS